MRPFLVIAGLLSFAAAGCTPFRFQHARTEQKSIQCSESASIDLSTFNGSVSVTAHEDPSIEMEITYKAYGSSQSAAKENCEALGCELTTDGSQVTIVATKPSDQWSSSASVALDLKVPSNANVKLTTSNGRVSVSHLAAETEIKTSNGSIECEGLDGPLVAETSNGSIEVRDSRCNVRANTSNGKVFYSGRLVGDANEIYTSNGNVTLTVMPDSLLEVIATTSNGRVECLLPMQRVMEDSKRSLHAVVGEESEDQAPKKISITTSNGSIQISPWMSDETSGGSSS